MAPHAQLLFPLPTRIPATRAIIYRSLIQNKSHFNELGHHCLVDAGARGGVLLGVLGCARGSWDYFGDFGICSQFSEAELGHPGMIRAVVVDVL